MYDPKKPHNDLIAGQIKRTWNTRYVTVNDGVIFRKHPSTMWEVDHTDGIGTKGIFHWKSKTLRNAVLDAIAMNVNDLQMYRAKPFKLQNHIMLPEDNIQAIETVITSLVDICEERDIAITGGECSIHDNIQGMEISITMSGFMDYHYPNKFSKGDVLIGLASSGLHSNGFTFVRKLMQDCGSAKLPFRDCWLTPTRIYNMPEDMSLEIKGIQHITGGAFSKLKKHLHNTNIYIHRNHGLEPQDEFKEIYKCHHGDCSMYNIFNCGIGMVIASRPKNVDNVIKRTGGTVIGEVQEGDGKIIIESKFSTLKVSF